MNRLKGIIIAIESNSHMALVDVAVGDEGFSATLLETPATASYLQVGQAVALLDQNTQQNAALVEESAAAAESLRHQATQLTEAVSFFRLGAGGHGLSSPA